MNMEKSTDEIIQDFENTPKLLKVKILSMASAFEAKVAEERLVLKEMYNEGRDHRIVFMSEDIAVLENFAKPTFPESPFTVSVKNKDGKWSHISHYYESAEIAFLGGLGVKHEGLNSRFANYAARMLTGK